MISDADLIAYIRPSTTDDLPTLRRLEQAAIAYIQTRTGRYFGAATTITDSLFWRGWPMALANDPIGGVVTTFESWNGTAWSAVAAGSYYTDGRFIFWQSGLGWSSLTMPTRYRATYSAGYAVATEPFQLEDGSSLMLLEDGSNLLLEGDAAANAWDAPDDIKQAVLLLVGHWFENREAVVVGASSTGELPLAVSALIDGHIRAAA